MEAINVEDKRVINGSSDINQLAPFKYPWAWEYFINANENHWTPTSISMDTDISDYKNEMNSKEKHLFENVLSYLTTSDILAMRNIGLAIMDKMTAPEIQIYNARQIYEEALHTWTYQHCIETLNLNQQEIYNRYRVVPAINKKITIANSHLAAILDPTFNLKTSENIKTFLLSYIFFAVIFEGVWFYNGFTPIFALARNGLMKNSAQQFQYIMRDEVLHCGFGTRVIRQIMEEENITADELDLSPLWAECAEAEDDYINYVLPTPILGYSATDHMNQFRYVANRRARQLGFPEPFPGAINCLPWLDELANVNKEKNFFETHVTEYRAGASLKWD